MSSRRILTALVLIPTVVYVMFGAPHWLFQLVVAALGVACFHEFAAIANAQRIRVPVWAGHAAGLLFLLVPREAWQVLLATAMAFMLWSLRFDSLPDVLPAISATMFGILYTYGAWKCAPILRDASSWWILFAVSINWVGDTAALYTGKSFGRHKLAPVVSPQKTWEGAAGATVFATLYGTVLLVQTIPQMVIWRAAVVSLAACVAGQMGDLVESAMKRGAGVKDSGTMLPGHGGWLDRLDSTLFSMPVVAFYLQAQSFV